MMIKNMRFRINVDPRGSISSGKLDDQGKPQKLDHFDVTDFPELLAQYGNAPAELVIYFPIDDPREFFDCSYVRYGKNAKGEGVKIRHCDGETCFHRITNTVAGKQYQAGEETDCVCSALQEDDKERCRASMWMKAWVADPKTAKIENPMCYKFTSHSQNSAENLFSEIEKIRALNNGVLRGIPFKVSVKMVKSSTDARNTFPIWNLSAIPMMSEIRRISNQMQLSQGSAQPIEEARTLDVPLIQLLLSSLQELAHTGADKPTLNKWWPDHISDIVSLNETDRDTLKAEFTVLHHAAPSQSKELFT